MPTPALQRLLSPPLIYGYATPLRHADIFASAAAARPLPPYRYALLPLALIAITLLTPSDVTPAFDVAASFATLCHAEMMFHAMPC